MTALAKLQDCECLTSEELGKTIEDLIDTDIERNQRLAKTIMFLLSGCTQMVIDIETLCDILKEHNLPIPEGMNTHFKTVRIEVCGK